MLIFSFSNRKTEDKNSSHTKDDITASAINTYKTLIAIVRTFTEVRSFLRSLKSITFGRDTTPNGLIVPESILDAKSATANFLASTKAENWDALEEYEFSLLEELDFEAELDELEADLADLEANFETELEELDESAPESTTPESLFEVHKLLLDTLTLGFTGVSNSFPAALETVLRIEDLRFRELSSLDLPNIVRDIPYLRIFSVITRLT